MNCLQKIWGILAPRFLLVCIIASFSFACATPDISEFGKSTTALTEAAVASQGAIEKAYKDYSDLAPSAIKDLEDSRSKLIQALGFLSAYSNALSDAASVAGTGKEAVVSIGKSLKTAAAAVGVKTDSINVDQGGIVGEIAQIVTQFQANKSLLQATTEADPIIERVAHIMLDRLAESQQLALDLLYKKRTGQLRTNIDNLIDVNKHFEGRTALSPFLAYKVVNSLLKDRGVNSHHSCGNEGLRLPIGVLSKKLEDQFTDETGYSTIRLQEKESEYPGVEVIEGGEAICLDLLVFVEEFGREISTAQFGSFQAKVAVDLHRLVEEKELADSWLKVQMAHIEAQKNAIQAWRSAHAQVVAHLETCTKLSGIFKARCGVLTFENLLQATNVLRALVLGPGAGVF